MRTPLILLAVGLLSCVALLVIYALHSNNIRLQHRLVMSPESSAFVDKAVSFRSRQQGVSTETVSKLNNFNVVQFPAEVCVGLSPTYGVNGGSFTACYSRRSGALTRRFDVGQ